MSVVCLSLFLIYLQVVAASVHCMQMGGTRLVLMYRVTTAVVMYGFQRASTPNREPYCMLWQSNVGWITPALVTESHGNCC